MALNKGFLRSRFKLALPRQFYWLTFFVWLGFSTSFYFFLFYTKEIARFMSLIGSDETYITLTSSEQFFHNSFLAWIAGLTGLALASSLLFIRKSLTASKWRTRTVVDANGLQWYFLFWYFKCAVIYVGLSWGIGLFEYINFMEYWYVFVLAGVVLFLHQWKNLILVFGTRGFRWQAITFLALIIFSSALAWSSSSILGDIDLANSKRLPQYYINLELPVTESTYQVPRPGLEVQLLCGFLKEKPDSIVVMTEWLYLLSWNEIFTFIGRSSDYSQDQIVSLRIDKNIPGIFIKKLLRTLRDAGQRRVLFTTNRNSGTLIYLPVPCEDSEPPPAFFIDCNFLYNTIKMDSSLVIKLKHDSIFVNHKFLQHPLETEIQRQLGKYPRSLFHIMLDDESRYESLVKVRTTLTKVYKEERKQFVKERFGITFKDESELEYDIRQMMYKNIPIQIVQWIGDEEQFR